jgi:DegT/DnrJ/EryC1/StrS aminotransferase family protein
MSRSAEGIERFFSQRYGREAIYLPSGRLALYLAFKEFLKPGDRLLMSPVDDDVVFFTVLAAGLLPVIGPLDPRTGNLDPDGVDETTLKSLRAVMTTNLYGIPDRMDRWVEICRRHDLLLLEDACQALDSRFGDRRVGEFSSVAVFSLTKHTDGVGGVLTFTESGRRAALLAAARSEIHLLSASQARQVAIRRNLRTAAEVTGTRALLQRLRRSLIPPEEERDGHRMAYSREEVRQEQASGAGLDRFERWVRVDNALFRTQPREADEIKTLRQLESFEENRRLRLEGTQKLLALSLTPPEIPLLDGCALFKVPLFIQRREEVVANFALHGMELDYIYDPPLDRYADKELALRIPSPAAALRWSRDVLPVNPLHADQFRELLALFPTLQAAGA